MKRKVMAKSDEVLGLLKATVSVLDGEESLEKAKYIRRWKGADGKWQYAYKKEKKGRSKSGGGWGDLPSTPDKQPAADTRSEHQKRLGLVISEVRQSMSEAEVEGGSEAALKQAEKRILGALAGMPRDEQKKAAGQLHAFHRNLKDSKSPNARALAAVAMNAAMSAVTGYVPATSGAKKSMDSVPLTVPHRPAIDQVRPLPLTQSGRIPLLDDEPLTIDRRLQAAAPVATRYHDPVVTPVAPPPKSFGHVMVNPLLGKKLFG